MVGGGATTRYIYSGSKPIAEYVGSTNPTLSKEYIYAGSTLLATIAGTSTTYHHPDLLSNRAETDSSGAPVRSFGHFPYGEAWYESSIDLMKFTTYSRDSGTGESGLDYAMFRQYNAGQGRFMSTDILAGHAGAPQSTNRYSYAGNDPINFADPLGLDQVSVSISGNCITYTNYGYGYVGGSLVNGKWVSRFGSIKEGSSNFCFPDASQGRTPNRAGFGYLPPGANPLLQALKNMARNFPKTQPPPTPPPNLTPGPPEAPYRGPGYPSPTDPTVSPNTPTWLKVVNAIGQVIQDLDNILGDIIICVNCSQFMREHTHPNGSAQLRSPESRPMPTRRDSPADIGEQAGYSDDVIMELNSFSEALMLRAELYVI